MTRAKDVFQYALGALIVISILVLVYVVFTVELPDKNKDVALMIIGALVAKFGDVVAYFYNSSKGSADKTEIISKLPPLPDDKVS